MYSFVYQTNRKELLLKKTDLFILVAIFQVNKLNLKLIRKKLDDFIWRHTCFLFEQIFEIHRIYLCQKFHLRINNDVSIDNIPYITRWLNNNYVDTIIA